MRRLLAALAPLWWIFVFPACVPAQEPTSPTVEFTILHLNDVYEVERPRIRPWAG